MNKARIESAVAAMGAKVTSYDTIDLGLKETVAVQLGNAKYSFIEGDSDGATIQWIENWIADQR